MPKLGALVKLVLVLVSALSVAACAALEHLSDLHGELRRNGYGNVNLNHNTHNGYATLRITLTSETAARPIAEADVLAVAKIVWETYPEHVDELRIQLNGEPAAIKRADLERAFGPRKPGLESGSDDSWWLIAFGPLAGAVIVILIIVIVRRRKRRKPPADPPYPSVFPSPQA